MGRKMIVGLAKKSKSVRKPLVAKATDAPPRFSGSPMRIIGQRLRQARRNRDMTQEYVGEKLDVTHSTIGQWELGRTMPDLPHMLAAVELYGVSMDWCCGRATATPMDAQVPDLIALTQRLIARIEALESGAGTTAAKRQPREVRDVARADRPS